MIDSELHEAASFMEFFHRVIRMIPDNQVLVCLSPDTPAIEALRIMQEKNFSQIPVVEGSTVIGVFSYRSFARGIVKLGDKRDPLKQLTVDEFVERWAFMRVTDELTSVFDHLDRDGAVLIGDPDNLKAIATSMDALRFFYDIASPFVMVAEMELAIRGLIHYSVDEVGIIECVENSLKSKYQEGKLPQKVEEMTFADYGAVIGDGRNWDRFKFAFGGARDRTRAKIIRLSELRNDIYHLKRELSIADYEELVSTREWLLTRTEIARARVQGVGQ